MALIQQLLRLFVGVLDARLVRLGLLVESLEVLVGEADLDVHVDRHLPEGADRRRHLPHYLLHFRLPRVVRQLGDVLRLGYQSKDNETEAINTVIMFGSLYYRYALLQHCN